MAEKIGLEAVLNMGNFNKGLGQYTKGIGKMEGETSKAAGIMGKFDDIMGKVGGGLSGLIPGVAGATAAIYALKKSFEFAKEGAAIAQTEESFNRLIESIGAAPDTINKMRAATVGTVDDMTLMSSTMTLLAGTTDDMGKALVDASPELLRIAKAANKLNPTLGDTAFLYQSLATGIKRSSPLILDNLGLTIKIGEANERYAKKLGISVEAMSAADKQMALLEETLRAGDVMIQQVGGSTDSMTDSFAQAETAMKNTTDELKKKVVPVWVSLLRALNDTLMGFKNLGAVLSGTIPLVDYFRIGMEMNRIELEQGAEAAREYQDAVLRAGGTETYTAWQDLRQEADRLGRSTGELTVGTDGLRRAYEELEVTTSDVEKAQKALDDVLKDIMKRYQEFTNTLAKGIVKYRDLGDQAEASSKKYEQALQDLAREGTKSLKQVQDGFEASLPDATTVEERMGMAEDAWDEWGLRIQDIIERGVESPWYALLEEMGYSKPPDVGMREWAEDLKQQFYAGQLPDLLPPEWAENVRKQQQEATAAVRQETANRRAELEKARQEELAAEQAARDKMLLELSLSLAEATGQLQAWSMQRFGPDFSQVADSADEVIALIDAGMLDIDAGLQSLITNTAGGIRQSLYETGAAAEQNKQILEDIFSTDWSAQAAETINLDDVRAQWDTDIGNMYRIIEDELPETPFDPLFDNFDDASQSIITQATLMGLSLSDTYGQIDTDWANLVLSQVTSWNEGMTEVEEAIQKKVIEKLEEIPKKIVIEVTTEQEGGEGRQHGGPVTAGTPYVVGEAGPELFVPDRAGTVIPNNWAMNLPALLGAIGGGGGAAGAPAVQITMNPTINTPMDLAEFEMMTERTVQRAIRGY